VTQKTNLKSSKYRRVIYQKKGMEETNTLVIFSGQNIHQISNKCRSDVSHMYMKDFNRPAAQRHWVRRTRYQYLSIRLFFVSPGMWRNASLPGSPIREGWEPLKGAKIWV